MNYEMTELTTGLPVILCPSPATPRMTLAVTIDGGVRREAVAGTAKMTERLLLKGTETRTAEALAIELDTRAIDLRIVTLADCSVIQAIFLNRELPMVLELVEDLLLHSTFADFDKEAGKLSGEIQASLDLPSEIAQDLLISTLFANNPYGNTGTRMLQALAGLDVDRVRHWWSDGLSPHKMNVAVVGDFSPHDLLPRLDNAFAGLPGHLSAPTMPDFVPVEGDQVVTRVKPEANQAQVYQGWYAPPLGAQEQAATTVMNTILGAAGLSSRLFTELRDKQGLAYSVRSQYAPMRQVGQFFVSIGTSPENIGKARRGFSEQIARLQQEPVSLDELRNAKGRLQGAYVLTHETNSQRCLDLTLGQINGFGPEYSEQLLQRIEEVTVDMVQKAAQSITSPSVTAIVAREDALPG